jgi:AcrR family transcriptional regulator
MPPRKQAAKKLAPVRAGGGPAQERELRAQGRQTMRKLLDAGMVAFGRRGYHAARVDDIVKIARTSHGTFYLYFANKEDLFRALLSDVASELNALSDSLGEIGPDEAGYHELRQWLARFLDIYEHSAPVIRAWTEAEMQDSDLGRLGDDVLSGFTRTLMLRIRGNRFADGVNPLLAAMALVAMVERFSYYLHSRRMAADPDEVLDTLTGIIHVGLFGGRRRVGPGRYAAG